MHEACVGLAVTMLMWNLFCVERTKSVGTVSESEGTVYRTVRSVTPEGLRYLSYVN